MTDEPDEHMFDLSISALADGGFELEQFAGGLDEPARIKLHPVQVRLLAERAGLLPAPDPKLLDRLSARHVGRLHALYERIAEIRRFYLDEILDHCGSGVEFSLHLRALEDLTDEMLEDVGTADGNNNAASVTPALPAEQCHAVPVANSVTRKPGPKPSGKALTPAERQRAHRERQAEPATAQQGALI